MMQPDFYCEKCGCNNIKLKPYRRLTHGEEHEDSEFKGWDSSAYVCPNCDHTYKINYRLELLR